jgi:hypothetical protein
MVGDREPVLARRIRVRHALRYFDFTVALELFLINSVTREIALGRSGIPGWPSMIGEAFQLYTDEAYHAQFSAELAGQIKLVTGCSGERALPGFLEELKQIKSSHSQDMWRLIDYLFVICSETMITGSLAKAAGGSEVAPGVQNALRDHAHDESRHHLFYSRVLKALWPQLSESEKAVAGRLIPQLIFAFLRPDVDSLVGELVSYGFSRDDALAIIYDTYTADALSAGAMETCAQTRHAFERVGFDMGIDSEFAHALESLIEKAVVGEVSNTG